LGKVNHGVNEKVIKKKKMRKNSLDVNRKSETRREKSRKFIHEDARIPCRSALHNHREKKAGC
jgi:hypothetical protein